MIHPSGGANKGPAARVGAPPDIDVRVRELRHLFNSIDPSPFNERDLDPAAEEFIVTWASEVPRNAPLRMVIHVDAEPAAGEADAVARTAVPQFFAARAAATRRKLHELFHRGRISLVIALAFMAAALMLASALDGAAETNPLAAVLRESLFIGGWVAMWRPIEVFLYDWWPLVAEARRFDRLAAMPVEVRHRA
jgi:hypothetical protein